MGGTSFDPRGTNPAGVVPQQGAPTTKPSLWDTWMQKAYSLRPLGSTLQQAGNNLEQRGINMLHGDGFRKDSQVYPPLPPPPMPRPLISAPTGGGLTVQRSGPPQSPTQNGQGTRQAPGGMSPYSRACVLAGLRGMIEHTEGTDLLPNGGYGSFAANGTVAKNPRNLSGITKDMDSNTATISDPSALQGHPRVVVELPRKNADPIFTSAFGRYQILGPTATGYNFTDFSPAGQDAAANRLLEHRKMVNAATQGDWATVFANGKKEWASLPGNFYKQGGKSADETEAAYNRAIQSAPECK